MDCKGSETVRKTNKATAHKKGQALFLVVFNDVVGEKICKKEEVFIGG